MAKLLSLTYVLLSFVSTSAASTECHNGKCDSANDGDAGVLLQGRVRVSAMEAADAVKPFKMQLTQAEEDVHKRLAARKPLLIEQDLSNLHKSHYAKLNRRSKNIFDALMEAFEGFAESSGIGQELTAEEQANFAARFEEDAEMLLKHAGVTPEALQADLQDGHIDEISDDVWEALVKQALEEEKPVCSHHYEDSINSAQQDFQISCAGIGNMSNKDKKKILGKKQDGQTTSLIETGGTYSTPDYQHMFDSSATPPPTLDSRTAWPDCSSVTGRVLSQGTCGSCWVFGALGSLDSRICIKTGGAFSGDNALLSRGYITSCASSNGCSGGLSRIAYELFRSNGGGVTGGNDGCSPYFGHGNSLDHFDASDGAPPCPTQCSNSNGYFRGIASDKFNMPSLSYSEVFRGQDNFDRTLQQAISQNGPVPYGIYANDAFMGYRSGIFTGDCAAGANHEVVAIGYGPTYVLGLNSWGTSWGDQGSFKVTYCTVTDFTLTTFTETSNNFPSPLFAGGSGGGEGGSQTTAAPTEAPTEAATCDGPWCVTSGPCMRDHQGCVTSPNWNGVGAQYENNQNCVISIDAAINPEIEVVDWNVEANYDKLMVNGAEYDGASNSAPLDQMVWTSDVSVTNTGWKICPRIESEPTTAPPVVSSTAAPITAAPSTAAPVTPVPSTAAPITAAPSTAAPVTPVPSTAAPVTPAPPPNSSAPITADIVADGIRAIADDQAATQMIADELIHQLNNRDT